MTAEFAEQQAISSPNIQQQDGAINRFVQDQFGGPGGRGATTQFETSSAGGTGSLRADVADQPFLSDNSMRRNSSIASDDIDMQNFRDGYNSSVFDQDQVVGSGARSAGQEVKDIANAIGLDIALKDGDLNEVKSVAEHLSHGQGSLEHVAEMLDKMNHSDNSLAGLARVRRDQDGVSKMLITDGSLPGLDLVLTPGHGDVTAYTPPGTSDGVERAMDPGDAVTTIAKRLRSHQQESSDTADANPDIAIR